MNIQRVAIVLIVASVVQVSFMALCNVEIVKDAKRYEAMAYHLSQGHGFTEDGENPSSLYPGAPVVFASIYAFTGRRPQALRVFQGILFVMLCVLVYGIGRLSFDDDVGFYASLVCAAYPPLLILPSILSSEFLFTVLLAVTVLSYIAAVRKGSAIASILTGILAAALTLIRPNGLFIIVFLIPAAACISGSARRTLRFTILSLVAFVLCMAPMTVRNYQRFGKFMPVSGVAELLVADHREEKLDRTKAFTEKQAERQFALVKAYYEKAGIPVEETEIREELKGRLGTIIPQDYTWTPRHLADGLRRLYIGTYSDIYQIGIPLAYFVKDPRLRAAYPEFFAWKLLVVTLSMLIAFCALLGFLFGVKRYRDTLPVFLVILYNTVFYLTYTAIWKTDITTRYGLPVVPYMILFAVFGCLALFQKSKRESHAE